MRPLAAALVAGFGACLTARASVWVTADIYYNPDCEFGSCPPRELIVVDVFVDVTTDDVWTAGALHVEAHNGLALRYATDPNTSELRLINPGTANKWVSFFSRPRARDSNGRFANAGAAIDGGYCPDSPEVTATPLLLDAAWSASPPPLPDAPSVDGYVARITGFFPPEVTCSLQPPQIYSPAAPAGYVTLLNSHCTASAAGTAATSQDVPILHGLDWAVAIPGPLRACPGDIDCDTRVDLADLTLLLSNFGCVYFPFGGYCAADLNHDGLVNAFDLAILLSEFGTSCP